MGFSKQKETQSESKPVFHETWLPGQKSAAKGYLKSIRDIYKGKLNTKTGRMLQTIVGESAMRETARQRSAITGTRGLSAPAKAKAISGLGGSSIQAMAGVPQTIWQQAAEALQGYATAAPVVAGGTVGTTTGGGGRSYGLCTCENLRAVNRAYLPETLRRFRDEHYDRFGDVARGYREMSKWFVPIVRSHAAVKFVARIVLLIPLLKIADFHYGRNHYGIIFYWAGKFWETFWKILGKRVRKHDFMRFTNF